jgi:hypothetical protein
LAGMGKNLSDEVAEDVERRAENYPYLIERK